jgi:CheY-like chemotaxis protein
VGDLLDVTRISHGKFELQLSRLDARDVVRRTCDDARVLVEQRGFALRYSLPAEPTWVVADDARLAQMIGNLVNNALKFTPRGGQVDVAVRAGERDCEVAVRDTGVGILAADLERIFEPFVQAGRTGHGAQAGLGIGLSLVRELATRHGGAVRAASPGLDRGAEFALSLPLAAAPAEDPSRPEAGVGAAPLSILVVEDNEDAGASLVDLLSLHGHAVKNVTRGRAGVEGDGPPARRPHLRRRPAGSERVRGDPRGASGGVERPGLRHRRHRVRAGGGPAARPRGRLRRPPPQAAAARRAERAPRRGRPAAGRGPALKPAGS